MTKQTTIVVIGALRVKGLENINYTKVQYAGTCHSHQTALTPDGVRAVNKLRKLKTALVSCLFFLSLSLSLSGRQASFVFKLGLNSYINI